jgi:hypothetical protein
MSMVCRSHICSSSISISTFIIGLPMCICHSQHSSRAAVAESWLILMALIEDRSRARAGERRILHCSKLRQYSSSGTGNVQDFRSGSAKERYLANRLTHDRVRVLWYLAAPSSPSFLSAHRPSHSKSPRQEIDVYFRLPSIPLHSGTQKRLRALTRRPETQIPPSHFPHRTTISQSRLPCTADVGSSSIRSGSGGRGR